MIAMAAFIVAVHAFRIPNPMVILMIPMVYSAYAGGYVGGLLSGTVAMGYSTYFFILQGNDPLGIQKVMNIALAILAIVILVGKLKASDEKNSYAQNALMNTLDEMMKLSLHDSLTGLNNRNCYVRDIEQLDKENEMITNIGVAYITINELKKVNNSLGHEYGDKILIACADE